MRKRVGVELDTEDPLDAQFLVDFVGVRNRGKWLRGCLLLGYLVATGRLALRDEGAAEAQDAPGEPDYESVPGQQKGKGIGNSLFGIK